MTRATWIVGGLLLAGILSLDVAADDKKPAYPKHPSAEGVKVIPDAWKKGLAGPINPAQLDQLLAKQLKAAELTPAPLTTDEQFIRRVTLDLTGKLPAPADVVSFVKSTEPQKRSKLIDRLLGSDDFARHWARYWRDVIASRATEMRIRRASGLFESWLFDQLKADRDWGAVARDIISAEGTLRFDEAGKNGQAFFLLCHMGVEAANERAAETSRVFMGIQIQCAQCHDHPNDIWKREQFHELAAFFGRVRERPVRDGNRLVGVQLVSLPRGEHQMPGKDDPRQSTMMHPKFLTGQTVARGQNDLERRKALADHVTSKDNYWFSAAYVNRVWGELMGQAFYQPVDQMGPLQDATYPDVLLRLSLAFRGSDYNIKDLFRTVMNSQTYQRQIRLGDSPDQHLYFAATYPTRLRADALWDSLLAALGPIQGGPPRGPGRPGTGVGPLAARFGLQGLFRDTFDFDPSTKSDEVEGSVPQALMLMNNPAINAKIQAKGDTVLAGILKDNPQDADAIKAIYLRTLARKPTARELETCRDYVAQVNNRAEAFEDILWSLINSTEFQTKR